MKRENIPNILTIARIIISIVVLALLLFPWDMTGISFVRFLINGHVILDIKYIIAGFFFVVASVTDFFDGYLARKWNVVSDFGKVMDAIADKILVNGILIVLCSDGLIPAVIPVIIILRDTIVNTIKMVAGNNGDVVGAIYTGKFKTAFLMVGITFKLLGNLPFSLINIGFADFCLITATILSIISGVQYYRLYSKYLRKRTK